MSYVFVQPPILSAAATELAGIGSALSEATAAAAGPTTGIAAAAADEVSTALANMFGAFGQEYQAISAQLSSFYADLTQRLTATANLYINSEAINIATLVQGATQGLYTPTSPTAVPPVFNDQVAIAMGGTGMMIPTPTYLKGVTDLYIHHLFPGIPVKPLNTPEQLYPITGVKSLPFATSVREGVQILDTAIWQELHAGNHVTVFGYSQSAVLASLEIQHFLSLGPNKPDPSMINFIFTGNEMNPNGGILARIPGINITTVGLPFYGATPDNPYQMTTYTIEYDGFADFPRYPLNIVSDINAIFGILTVHTTYASLTPDQIASATLLPTEGPTTGTYYMISHPHLPLLDPLRAIPVIGNPLAALIEPNLKVIVNLGYGDPNFGYSTSAANVPTPFGLFPDVPPHVIGDALYRGTNQGITDFIAALPTALTTAPTMPTLAFPPYIDTIMPPPPIPTPPTLQNVVGVLASVASTGYSVLLPTADLAVAMATILPAYNANLFVSSLLQGNLKAAIELPLAATFGLGALAGMIEFIAVVEATAEIIQDLQSLGL
ncbi:PE family protein [Mycobacterium szulgai]|uniref:PE family protein n=1 Tax=Mycobacterium szulgai TaxID=1787 RepID=A0A1X2DPS4_MYCSZ|nr:PE-PPE domain-containing protein [Mycobacterium szulgai]ORW90050.1 PE family protein [Mycobacterium szulgai]